MKNKTPRNISAFSRVLALYTKSSYLQIFIFNPLYREVEKLAVRQRLDSNELLLRRNEQSRIVHLIQRMLTWTNIRCFCRVFKECRHRKSNYFLLLRSYVRLLLFVGLGSSFEKPTLYFLCPLYFDFEKSSSERTKIQE